MNPSATTGKNPGDTFTVGLDVTNAPSNDTVGYNSFEVHIRYNVTVIDATQIDYSTTVLGSNPTAITDCIDGTLIQGTTCTQYDTIGVVSLVLLCLSDFCPTSEPVNVTLFKITFRVLAQGFSQLHPFSASITEFPKTATNSTTSLVTIPPNQIFDGYFTNSHCGFKFCTPPVLSFTLSPYRNGTDGFIQVRKNANVTFDASKSNATNPGARIVRYVWDWGDGTSAGIAASPIASHSYSIVTQGQLQLFVTLTVTDSSGAVSSSSFPIEVILIYIDLVVQSVSADYAQGVIPGAVLTLTAVIKNNSFLAENATVTIEVERTRLGEATLSGMSAFGVSQARAEWNTGGWTPAVYRINAVVDPVRNSTGYPIENDTSNNIGIGFVQLIEPMPSGSGLFLGLGLVNTTLVGLVVVIGIGASAGFIRRLFGRKPLPEDV